jgi:hypothetical protein
VRNIFFKPSEEYSTYTCFIRDLHYSNLARFLPMGLFCYIGFIFVGKEDALRGISNRPSLFCSIYHQIKFPPSIFLSSFVNTSTNAFNELVK